MSIRIIKVLSLQTLLLLSLLITACSEGDRDFVSIPDEPLEEEALPIIMNAAGVKGPLVNAEISLYKFDLGNGLIKQHNDASEAFFRLFLVDAAVEITEVNSELEFTSTDSDPIKLIRDTLLGYGYVTELTGLQAEIENITAVDEAKAVLDDYLSNSETNSIPKEQVQTIRDSFATLTELKNQIALLEPFEKQMAQLTSFSSARNLIDRFKAKESNTDKRNGWNAISSSLNLFKETRLSTIRRDISEKVETLTSNNQLEQDLVALNRLQTLEINVDKAASAADAEALIAQAITEEGNKTVIYSLAELKDSIVSFEDFNNKVQMGAALYHFSNIREQVLVAGTLEAIYNAATSILQSEFEPAFEDAFINAETELVDGQEVPKNLIAKGLSNDSSLLSNITLEDYSGYVYMEVNSSTQTLDLNSGKAPLIPKLNTLFHTDVIRGYGDNAKENRTLFYFKNGQEQRDEQGVLITDEEIIKSEKSDELFAVHPHRSASPLTKFALSLVLERFKTFQPQKDSSNNNIGKAQYRITDSVLKSELLKASTNIIEAFGIGLSEDENIFDAPSIFTLPMQYSSSSQELALQHRATIESFSAFINSLNQEINIDTESLFNSVVKDFMDGEIDGVNGETQVGLESASDLAFLVQRSPNEILIPGTNYRVSDIADLMSLQLSVIEPDFTEDTLDIESIVFSDHPKGGLDSDGDTFLDNSDSFPNDATRHSLIEGAYVGVWAVEIPSSHNYIVPLSGEFHFSLKRKLKDFETSKQVCDDDVQQCYFEGGMNSSFETTWEVISSPVGGDLLVTSEESETSEPGFKATGSVPGVYQVRMTLVTNVAPKQTYSEIIPLKIIDPNSIEIVFKPDAPDIGESVDVEFLATTDICIAYTFCDSNDVGTTHINISKLEEFKVFWSITGAETKQYRTLTFKEDPDPDSDADPKTIINTELGDVLNIEVVFSSAYAEFVVKQESVTVGTKLEIDSDGDGINNGDDAFPDNEDCSRQTDGFDDQGTKVCNAEFISNVTRKTDDETKFGISFNEETWVYDESWNRIFRALDLEGPDYTIDKATRFLESILLPNDLNGDSKVIALTIPDPVTRRVYIAYTDGEIDYFSFDTNQLHDFTDSIIDDIPVAAITPKDLAVLVEYKQGGDASEFRVYQRSGELSIIEASVKYPKPGLAVTLTIDGNDIAGFAQNLDLKWTLTRLNEGTPEEIIINVSNDSLSLLVGQTNYGDIVTVSFENDTGEEVKRFDVAIIDTTKFILDKNSYKETELIRLISPDFDLDSANAEKFIKVKWLKYDVDSDTNKFQSFDYTFPYAYSAKNTEKTDIVIAEVYLENGSDKGHLLETHTALILGDLESIFEITLSEPVFDTQTKDFFIEITSPTNNDKYFNEYFTPIWKIDGETVPGENSLFFPSNSETKIKFGSNLTLLFHYELDNNNSGDTSEQTIFRFEFDLLNSRYSLVPRYPEAGQDISVDFSEYTEESLLGMVPRWFINGELDTTATEYTYAGGELKFGDHVRLRIEEEGENLEGELDPPAFANEAEVYIGVNIVEKDVGEGLDDDGDGVLNNEDYFRLDAACFKESDGSPDDADMDGISDLAELLETTPTEVNNADSDNDGLSDFDEKKANTDPNNSDKDNDGFNDGLEVNQLGTDPLDDQSPASSEDDLDRDGVLNDDELLAGTFVNNADSDNDGLFDGMELKLGTDPLNPDTDGDGLSDGLEVHITHTAPVNKPEYPDSTDTDGDGLSDGVEVRLLGFNPKAQDTDNDGIKDSEEPDVDGVGALIPGEYLNIGDLNNYAFGKTLPMVPAGTCYATWLGQQDIDSRNVVVSHELQEDADSEQQIAFSHPSWAEILRYDAKAGVFLSPIAQDVLNGQVTALEYEYSDSGINALYLGYETGHIRQFTFGEKQTKKIFEADAPILHIIDQDEILLVETINTVEIEAEPYRHYLFKNPIPDQTNIPLESSVNVSYKNNVWLNDSRTELALLGDEPVNTSLVNIDVSTISANNWSQNSLVNTDGLSLLPPMFIETENVGLITALNIGSGVSFDLTNNEWLENTTLSAFEHGFQHNQQRVSVLANSSLIELNTQDSFDEESKWLTIQQLENHQVLSVLPVGENTLAISHFTTGVQRLSHQPPLAFEIITSGDFDNDGLTDDEELADGSNIGQADSDLDGISDYDEELITSIDFDKADTDEDGIPDADEDHDSDGLSNLIELTLTLTNPIKKDTDGDTVEDGNEDQDGDGLTDAEEILITGTSFQRKDSDEPVNGINDPDEDLDQDGLSNIIELRITLTDPRIPDSDKNGVKDGDEDFDGDDLTNLQELLLNPIDFIDTNDDGIPDSFTDTDGDGKADGIEDTDSDNDAISDKNEDIDSDGISDFIEFNPPDGVVDKGDTDGDGLINDFEAVLGTCIKFETPNCSNPQDTDNDGISDFDEVLVYGTNPLLDDTDADSIKDFDEITVYLSDPTSEDGDSDGLLDTLELGLVLDPENPLFRSNPKLKDSDNDGLSDFEEYEFIFSYSEKQIEQFAFDDEPSVRANPTLADSDGDDLSDYDEVNLANGSITNPALADTDNDGLSDYDEVNPVNGSITNPVLQDTDNDGLTDSQEIVITLTDPTDSDSDDDGILDGDEDTDGDGLSDADEINLTGTDFQKIDTDDDGIDDPLDDQDNDGLSNIDELEKGTDPRNPDTDGDEIPDNEETKETANSPDVDGDRLNDKEERDFGSDPTKADTDGDGLDDFDERARGSNPNDPDTDNDFLKDGEEGPLDVLKWDSDLDGIPDGIEVHVLSTSPNIIDSDGDGLKDGEEAWVYAYAGDEIISVGLPGFEEKLNSRDGEDGFNESRFTLTEEDLAQPKDRRIFPSTEENQETVIDDILSDLGVTLYVKMVSDPNSFDSDGDGLSDFTELKLIEFNEGNKYDPDDTSTYDPNKPNSESFFLSDPWQVDTADENGIRNLVNDGDEDIDGDFYINVLDQDNDDTGILDPHSDLSEGGDGILDGIEVLLLSSDPALIDTDEDGVSDDKEMNGAIDPLLKVGPIICRIENAEADTSCFNSEIGFTEIDNPCLSSEVRLANIAGVDYCFTLDFKSLPSTEDSDNDGVLDGVDSYALDESCFNLNDGFTDNETSKQQCFASWMVDQGDIKQIESVQWQDSSLDDQSQIAFFTKGWDKVVRFDTSNDQYLPLILSSESADLIRIAYSPLDNRLYLAYEDGLIRYFDLESGDTFDLVQNVRGSETELETIVVAGTSLIVQLRTTDTNEYRHKIYDASGQEVASTLSGALDFNLNNALWDKETLRLYGFKQLPNQSAISDVGFVNIDTATSKFNGAIDYSQSLASEDDLSGPLTLSQNGQFIYLGSGQKRLADLSDAAEPVLNKSFKGTTYSKFSELIELGDHFISVVDVVTETNPIEPNSRDGIFIEDVTVLNDADFVNNTYVKSVSNNEQILKLVPFIDDGNTELAFVSQGANIISIERLGLRDKDNDGMTGIYEDFYGLNDNDAEDRFTDPDSDFLTNIEEYNYATDPLKEDTDGDTWDDHYEVNNGTDPLDSTVF